MTNLIRFRDPFASVTGLHSQLDDMVNEFFSSSSPAVRSLPAVDIYTEDDKQLVTEVQAPGFAKDDIEVSVNNNILEIKGQKSEKTENKEKKRSYMVRESHASFYRSIALPKHADADNINADFIDGVLKVTVPFRELPQPKKVVIGGGSANKKL
ncbi:MAG TPA: Hsp20/alpha crystallin family protein [Candidatus Saccharimonadales bacterium]|jgi:HSP20 family molecular chaperone IbpA